MGGGYIGELRENVDVVLFDSIKNSHVISGLRLRLMGERGVR